MSPSGSASTTDVRDYWNRHIHDLEITRHPVGSPGFFADLDEYALLHQAARWARGESVAMAPSPGDGSVTPAVAEGWRAILLRQPRWRSDAEAFHSGQESTPDVHHETPNSQGPTCIARMMTEGLCCHARPLRGGEMRAWYR